MSFRDFFNPSGEKKRPSPAEVDAFIAAAAEGNEKAVKKFCKNYPAHVDAANKDGATALNAAARNNQVAVGEILLEAKADPNKPSLFGESPFFTRIALSFHYRDDYRLLDKMLLKSANVNFQQKAWAAEGLKQEETLTTPLMEAAALGDEKLCDWLLIRVADPTMKDKDGKTARDMAAERLKRILEGNPGVGVPAEDRDEILKKEADNLGKIIAKLETAEKKWAYHHPPASEWPGKVDPLSHTYWGH